MFKLFKLSYELLTLLVACLMHAVITLYCLIYFASFVHYKIKKKKKKNFFDQKYFINFYSHNNLQCWWCMIYHPQFLQDL